MAPHFKNYKTMAFWHRTQAYTRDTTTAVTLRYNEYQIIYPETIAEALI